MEKNQRKPKPEYDKLSEVIQVLLKKTEYKNFDRVRRERGFASNTAYVRMLILKETESKKQLELI